jgi:hypothetical protein
LGIWTTFLLESLSILNRRQDLRNHAQSLIPRQGSQNNFFRGLHTINTIDIVDTLTSKVFAGSMQKAPRTKSIPVQGRLTPDEVAELDRAAADQSVPVDRSTMISFVLRKWLESQRGHKPKARK